MNYIKLINPLICNSKKIKYNSSHKKIYSKYIEIIPYIIYGVENDGVNTTMQYTEQGFDPASFHPLSCNNLLRYALSNILI